MITLTEVSTGNCFRYCEAINTLLAQQTVPKSEERQISAYDLLRLLSPSSGNDFHLWVAYDDERTVGMGSIFFQRNLARMIAEIHDVVVLEEYRGMGIGEKIIQQLLSEAERRASIFRTNIKLYLTSRPSREAANHLYQKLGFTLVATASGEWGTNLYKKMVISD